MDRKKHALKSGVVGLSEAEQRQVRGGRVVIGSSQLWYRYYLLNYRRSTRSSLYWMGGSGPAAR